MIRKTEYADKTVAANIDTIVIVCASEPTPSLDLIDHYLLASELLPAQAIITVNKTDLLGAEDLIENIRNKYQHLPYPLIQTNKTDSSSLATLLDSLKNKTCIFVGQSGVGKSTLINVLIPNLEIETQAISEQISQGRHTTSTTTLYDLPNGGELIDSPGVRDFAIPELDINLIIKGFIEIDKTGRDCKFHDCKHINEPQCAVKLAVENDEINEERYQVYKNLLETLK